MQRAQRFSLGPSLLLALLALGCSREPEPTLHAQSSLASGESSTQQAPPAEPALAQPKATSAQTQPTPASTPSAQPSSGPTAGPSAAGAPGTASPTEPPGAPSPHSNQVIVRGKPEPPTQALLRGVIFDDEGKLVANANVLLVAGPEARTPYARIAGTVSDREGGFHLELEPPAQGLLLVIADGLLPHVEPLTPREAGEHQLGAIPLERGAVLSGVAEGCGPRGMVWASLQASYVRTDYMDTADLAWIDGQPVKTYIYGRTEGERFELGGLIPGKYQIGAHKLLLGGECRAEGVEAPPTYVDAPASELVLRDDDPLVRVEVHGGGHLLAGASVAPIGSSACTTGESGVVYWRVLPDTDYLFRVEAEGFQSLEREVPAPARGAIAQLVVELERP